MQIYIIIKQQMSDIVTNTFHTKINVKKKHRS